MFAILDSIARFLGYVVLFYLLFSAAGVFFAHFALMRQGLRDGVPIVDIWEPNLKFGFIWQWGLFIELFFTRMFLIASFFSRSWRNHFIQWYAGPIPTIREIWGEYKNLYWCDAETG